MSVKKCSPKPRRPSRSPSESSPGGNTSYPRVGRNPGGPLGLVAAALGVLISAPAFAQHPSMSFPPAPQGNFGESHHEFHKFYNSETLMSGCCHDQDCRPTQWTIDAKRGALIMIQGKWCPVDLSKVRRVRAPDGGAHVCTSPPIVGQDPCNINVYCEVLGDGA